MSYTRILLSLWLLWGMLIHSQSAQAVQGNANIAAKPDFMVEAKTALNRDEYRSTDDIEKWASKEFFGGYEKPIKLIHDKQIVFIINGSRTSGLTTSEVHFFIYLSGDKIYKRVLTRGLAYGAFLVEHDKEGVRLFNSKKEMILFIPWIGFEYGLG